MALEKLKDELTSPRKLLCLDHQRPFFLETDASAKAYGAVLLQEKDCLCRPVAFLSGKFSPAELIYTISEYELLAIIVALKH
jgi:RNase H-like domain found in reverse transcriptase